MNGKPNVTKVRINFLERAHPVFACEFYWHIGKQHNFERGNILPLSVRDFEIFVST